MQPQLLFAAEDLPIPVLAGPKKPSWTSNVVKLSKKAIAELLDKMQLNFNDLLNRPVLGGSDTRKRSKKRDVEWEDAKVFEGSITITQRCSEAGSSNALSDWSSDQLGEVHQWIFEESIQALKEEGNAEEKLDILEWIFTPSFITKVGISHDNRPCLIRRHASDIPFSFMNCCRSVGIGDPDSFRELLVEQMSDEFRPQLEKYLQITQGMRPK